VQRNTWMKTIGWAIKTSQFCLMIFVMSMLVDPGSAVTRDTTTDGHTCHMIVYPQFNWSSNHNCNQEAAAYAAAITELNDARRVADEAYRRWYDCEMQGGGNGPRGLDPQPKSSIPAAYETGEPQWSILVDSIPSS